MATNDFTDPQDSAGEGVDALEPQGASETGQAEASTSASAEELAVQLEQAKAEGAAHYESFLRAKADAENARRRGLEDVAKARKFGTESFAESLLPVMDSLEAALSNPSADAGKLREGVELTLRQLQTAFERNQLTAIDPAGQRFDPHKHQAISTQAMPGVEPNHVGQVLQKGWAIADRVLRPALVTVGQ